MEDYATVSEAARRLNRSIEQVRRYLREGKLLGRRIGGQWFIEEAALVSWRPAGVRETAAVYEAKSMKTKKAKKTVRLISDELIKSIEETRDMILSESGPVDVVALVRESRDSH